MYDLKPVGKYKLTVCTNLPCMLSGGVDAGDYLKKKLGVGFNETTSDGKITLREGECMGACGDAPVMLVNNRRMCSCMLPEPVSYTHLDVYKRQIWTALGSCFVQARDSQM